MMDRERLADLLARLREVHVPSGCRLRAPASIMVNTEHPHIPDALNRLSFKLIYVVYPPNRGSDTANLEHIHTLPA